MANKKWILVQTSQDFKTAHRVAVLSNGDVKNYLRAIKQESKTYGISYNYVKMFAKKYFNITDLTEGDYSYGVTTTDDGTYKSPEDCGSALVGRAEMRTDENGRVLGFEEVVLH